MFVTHVYPLHTQFDNFFWSNLSFIFSFQILKAMGLVKTASSAVNLLIDIGYFPVHVNLELLKLNIPTDHSDEILTAAESLLSESSDPDEVGLRTGLEINLKYLCRG